MSKVWHITLDPASVSQCIDDLRSYARSIDRKCDEIRRRVADLIARHAQAGFTGAVVDDLTPMSGSPRIAHVDVSVKWDGPDSTMVIASGEDAVWVEFGAGVHYNGAVGTSRNPLSALNGLGFTIGGYGKNGAKQKWAFVDGGQVLWSYGTPTGMPLYKAIIAAKAELVDIAREVFADDRY